MNQRQRRHYDVGSHQGRVSNAVLRDRLFAAPDARGNIPHLTRETADHESRRINATMYETVGEMDAALDQRLQPSSSSPQAPRTSSGGGSWLGSLVLIGLGAALAWVVLSDDEDEADAAKDVTPVSPRENPVPMTAPTNVNVVVPPAQTTTNFTPLPPVPVVVPPPRRRRRRVKPAPTVVVETKPVVAVEPEKPEKAAT